jgi:hypothetical protein
MLHGLLRLIGFFAGKTPESESEAATKVIGVLIGFAIYFFSVWTVSGYVIQ